MHARFCAFGEKHLSQIWLQLVFFAFYAGFILFLARTDMYAPIVNKCLHWHLGIHETMATLYRCIVMRKIPIFSLPSDIEYTDTVALFFIP